MSIATMHIKALKLSRENPNLEVRLLLKKRGKESVVYGYVKGKENKAFLDSWHTIAYYKNGKEVI